MSLFGRALAGAGGAAANLAQSYINAEMEQQKAQALADMQFAGAKRLDEYNLSDERQGRVTAAETARERAVGAARNETALAGKRAEASDAGLTSAMADRDTILGKAKTRVDIDRATEMLPLEVRRAYALADAQVKASARHREAPGADMAATISIAEKTLGRPMTELEKLGLLGLAKGRDPEMDTETVKVMKRDPATGEVIEERVRKEVRRPGQATGPLQAETDDPIKASMDAARQTKQGKNGDATNAPRRKDPLSGQMLTESEWDKKFGRGDFKRLYAPGEASLKSF